MPRKSDNLASLLENDDDGFKREMRKLPKLIANEAVNEFTENFRRQGFKDQSTRKWKQRKGNTDPGRGILIGKGGGNKLSRSIRKLRASQKRVIVGSTIHYAGVHNYGLKAGRGKGFTMPKRQFIGHSKALSDKIIKLIKKRTDKGFDK